MSVRYRDSDTGRFASAEAFELSRALFEAGETDKARVEAVEITYSWEPAPDPGTMEGREHELDDLDYETDLSELEFPAVEIDDPTGS